MAPRKATGGTGRGRGTGRSTAPLTFARDTELVGITFELEAMASASLAAQYTVGLHAWLLDQVRQMNPELSAYLHDGESEKAFTLSGLEGMQVPHGTQGRVQAGQRYRWTVTALAPVVVQWLQQWLEVMPPEVGLHPVSLKIGQVSLGLPEMTYRQLLLDPDDRPFSLSFVTATSFRRRGHHFPLPDPRNVFHSYLRRWNDFSGQPVDQDAFLDWVEDSVIIHRHRLESLKVAAGKRGSVTGFTGAIELGLTTPGRRSEFAPLFYALGRLAPYCGTGHKTTFGLGQTRSGWLMEDAVAPLPTLQSLLAERIDELTQIFFAQRKRSGGERAQKTAETWATILARRELGDSLATIAQDLEMKEETVKTYVKLARRSLKEE